MRSKLLVGLAGCAVLVAGSACRHERQPRQELATAVAAFAQDSYTISFDLFDDGRMGTIGSLDFEHDGNRTEVRLSWGAPEQIIEVTWVAASGTSKLCSARAGEAPACAERSSSQGSTTFGLEGRAFENDNVEALPSRILLGNAAPCFRIVASDGEQTVDWEECYSSSTNLLVYADGFGARLFVATLESEFSLVAEHPPFPLSELRSIEAR